MQTIAIIPAAGHGSRMGGEQPKQFLSLAGKPILSWTLDIFEKNSEIDGVIVVAPAEFVSKIELLINNNNYCKITRVVQGGQTRQDSVAAGLRELPENAGWVVVHDAARPMLSQETLSACIRAAKKHDAAIAAIPVKDTLKKQTAEKKIERTIDRSGLWQAQTPQVALVDWMRKAHAYSAEQHLVGTDEASLLESAGFSVSLIEGSEKNIKITRPEDLMIAEALMNHGVPQMRIGHGYDVHQLVEHRKFILGGVTIPWVRGLLGHSDADVVTHALCDALLGALGKGDIGGHFPDNDPQYKGISSLKLLEEVISLMENDGFVLGNADITVIAQSPKISPYIEEMRQNLAERCRTGTDRVNIKATTTEKLGFPGRGEGIATHAVVVLKEK